MRKVLVSRCPLVSVLLLALVSFSGAAFAQKPATPIDENLELRRPVRSWEFVDATGSKAALLGNETGRLEAWVYPLKLFRNFTLRFHGKDQELAAEEMARELIVRPESTTIVYASGSWAVRETLLVPPDEPGAMIRLDIDTFAPLQVEAQFVRDFQLMWPAAIGGSFMEWDKKLGVFVMGHEEKKYAGIIGSPATAGHQLEFLGNAISSDVNSLLLQPVEKGHVTQYIYVTGSVNGRPEAEMRYRHLIDNAQQLQVAASQYFKDFLRRTVSLELPDPQLQAAYDWSRISMYQGVVENPFLGRGLVAGYRTSGFNQRPGFAWFFGRDSLWSDFAFDSIGDFSTTRAALEFIFKFQRDDGKVEHEIPQTATLVPWVKDFPQPYASADATPLFILAINDYVTGSGDVALLNQHWDNVWRAYQFLKSTYDPLGLSRNGKFGHGWVEGGPLLPVESEIYQSGLGTAALAALANLARISGKAEQEQQLRQEYALHRKTINEVFWSDPQHSLIFALNEKNERVELPTVLSTAPMWFEVFDPAKANATIDHLAAADHLSDWGMRILSKFNPLFDPEGYHFGSVWPLFTGWASLAEYVYHRPLAAYTNLQANAHLAFDGSLGHVTEVLSGSHYEPLPTSCPHQIWSSAMVVSPLIRGLLGITSSATENEIVVAPHTPAGWNSWSAKNVPACGGTVDLIYGKTSAKESLQAVLHKTTSSSSERDCRLLFSPGVSPHAKIGRSIKVRQTAVDQHPTVSATLSSGRASIDIPVQGDFQLAIADGLPDLGETSSNLRIVQESWSSDHKRVQLLLNGLSGSVYQMNSYGAAIASADGAHIVKSTPDHQLIEVRFPNDAPAGEYTSWTITLSFSSP